MKKFNILASAAVALGLSLQGCVFDESGTEYKEPNANTEPVINLNYDSQLSLNTYLTFEDNSADIAVTFGSQEFRFPDRSEMRLRGFGDFETDRVWKTSVIEDSRGIKTLRLGYYVVTPNSNDISAPIFHNFAKDSRGNIYLTETAEQLKSDLGVAPFRQPQPALLFPAKVEVGDSWVAGPTIVPLFYNFSSGTGWTATLIDDDATAPISGEKNCIVIKYYGERFSYYLYLKNGLGVVEWTNSWEEGEDGTVVPINGWARSKNGGGTTAIDYTDFGWSFDDSNPVGAVLYSIGLKVVDGEEANADASTTSPVNDSGYNFTRVIESTAPTSNAYPALLDLRLPDERGEERIDFTESKWDSLAGKYYRPLVRISFNGKTYSADQSNGSFKVEKLYNQPFGPARLAFLGRGTLVNEADAADSMEFVGLLEGNYLNAGPDGLTSDFAIFGLGPDRRLPAAKPGSTYRIYIGYANLNEPLRELLEMDQASIDEFNLDESQLGYTSICYGNRTSEDGPCDSGNVSFEIQVPDVEGELGFRVGGRNGAGEIQSASKLFFLPVSKDAGSKGNLTARLFDQYSDVIRGSLDNNGEFNTGILNALSSISPSGNIVKYSYDLGDGTVVDDGIPLGNHTYRQDGEYQIKLTVTDDQGNTSTASRKVVISNTGKLIIRNIANDFSSGAFTIGIDNSDEPDGYYDYYKFVILDKGEDEIFEVPGGVNYEVDIIDNGEVVFTDELFVGNAEEEIVEVDLDQD